MNTAHENQELQQAEVLDETIIQITGQPKRRYTQQKNPVALNLASEVQKTVARNDVVNDTLDRYDELLQLQRFFNRKAQKDAISAKATGMEEMIIAAIQNNAQPELVEAMRKTAGVTDARLAELKLQV